MPGNYDDWKRALNLARDAQIAALPPQPPRCDGSFWQFTRRPWVHAFNLRAKSYAVGEDLPLTARLKDDNTFRDVIAAALPDLNLDELLVLPDMPQDIYDSIDIQSASYDPSSPDAATLALYEPTGINRTAQFTKGIDQVAIQGPYDITFTGSAVPAPCIIKAVSWVMDDSGNTESLIGSVSGLGTVFNVNASTNVFSGQHGMGNLNVWVLSGSVVPTLEAVEPRVFASQPPSLTLTVICELLRRKL